ncbi:MAG TPA: tail fiber protein, partial [Prosthecobacter sp.]
TTPAAADHTDFGSVFSGSTLARTFRISNVGAGSLNLTGTPPNYVSVSGSSDFTVTAQPSSASIGGSSSVTFNVTFTPSSEGQKTATVSILNNDSDESPYTFNITGLAAASVSGSTGSGNTIDTHQPSLQLRYMIAYDGENPAAALDSTGDGILIGEVRLFTANLVPGNWLECKGQAVSRTTYAALFNVAGTFFGAGDGSTTFNVPDLRLRVPIGTGPGFPLGSTHGGTNVAMTQAQMPAHTHSFPGGTTSSTGGTTPLPTRQPSLALTHLIAYSGVFPTVGEIRLFAGETAPSVHWLKAQGQSIPVSTYSTLFSKIGNVYGGDLINFLLPNFVGRSVVGVGQGPGLTDRPLGSMVGVESVTLTAANLPEHTHTITGGNTGATGQNPPTGVSLIQPSVAVSMAINPFGIFPTAGGTAQTALTGEGRIFAYASSQLMNAGMLPMDGSLQDIALYDTLFNLIGTTYGGDGVVNFATPDTRGRVIMGLADDLQLGNQLGSETVVLTVGNLPPHTHNLSAASAELAVLGNSQTIPSGDTTPGAADGTAFGSVPVTGGSSSRTYTLSNAGSGDLNLLGTPPNYVAISGSPDFTVTTPPATPVAAGGSTSFTVTFNPSSSGLKSATVTIASDSAGGGSYTFAIEGSGSVPGPITWTGGDTLTGGGAPGEDGTTEIGTFNVLGRGAFLAENGDLVFPGSLLEQVGPPLVTAANSTGLWKVEDGSLALAARSGTTVPDVAGAQFATLPEVPGINDAGEISLLGSLVIGTGGVTADNDTGLWSELGGSGLGLLIREDDVVIAAPESRVGKFASGLFATAQTGTSTGEAVFSVTLRGASTQTAIVRASVTGAGVSLGVVAQEGTTAPGATPPAVYANVAGSYSDPGRMDAQGNFVFAALTTPGSKEGIWYQPVGGAVAKVFFAGESAPNTGGATFARLQRPSIGANGYIAFRANLNSNGDNADTLHNDGIWAGNAANPASFSCILRRGDGTGVVSNLPPGTLVGNPWGGWLTNSNLGAWKAWLDVNGDGVSAAPADVHAIYTNLTGAMQLHLKVGDAAPGTGNATFSGFDLPMVGGDNQYAFLGNLTGGDTVTSNNQGLWKSGPDGGALALALRKGDVISTSEGSKTILKIDVPGSTQTDRRWEQPVMDSTGRMVVFVTFTDGSTSQLLVP